MTSYHFPSSSSTSLFPLFLYYLTLILPIIFVHILEIFLREIDLFRRFGFDRLARLRARKAHIMAHGHFFRMFDAVKVTEPGHKYAGHTGIITRIDENKVGLPLFEVKLDHFNCLTYVLMENNALIHYEETVSALSNYPAKPILPPGAINQPFIVFGNNGGDPFYGRANAAAAWTIQRAFRIYRSRKIAARLRFELWERTKAQHASMLAHLMVT